MRINQSPWDQNTKTHLCYRDGTKARFAKASENTWIQVGKALNPPHPFHILPKPIVISHPSFFPRCQIFPKVALGACAMTRDRTFSSRSYFGLFLLIFQNPLKARLARNATNPRLSLGVRYLPFTTPTSSWAQLYEFWKASLKGYHQHHDDEHQHQHHHHHHEHHHHNGGLTMGCICFLTFARIE